MESLYRSEMGCRAGLTWKLQLDNRLPLDTIPGTRTVRGSSHCNMWCRGSRSLWASRMPSGRIRWIWGRRRPTAGGRSWSFCCVGYSWLQLEEKKIDQDIGHLWVKQQNRKEKRQSEHFFRFNRRRGEATKNKKYKLVAAEHGKVIKHPPYSRSRALRVHRDDGRGGRFKQIISEWLIISILLHSFCMYISSYDQITIPYQQRWRWRLSAMDKREQREWRDDQ